MHSVETIAHSRSVLYYPTIKIPPNSWLRHTVLYWDNVGSIVPQSYDDRMDEEKIARYGNEIQYLYENEQFRPFNPDRLFSNGTREERTMFDKALRESVKSREFKKYLPPKAKRKLKTKIFKQKLTQNVFSFLEKEHLAEKRRGNSRDDHHYYYFEEHAALLFMSILAEHLAHLDSPWTAIGTDKKPYFELAHSPNKAPHAAPVLSVNLDGVLPTPSPDVSFKKIVRFKRKYREEFLSLWSEIDDLNARIANAEDKRDAENSLLGFTARIEKETRKLERAMRSARWTAGFGSVGAFIKPNSPVLFGAAAIAAGKATKLSALPVEVVATGAALAGTVQLGLHFMKSWQERDSILSGSAFSYLYQVNRRLR